MIYFDRVKVFIKIEFYWGFQYCLFVIYFYECIFNMGIYCDFILEGVLLDGYCLLFMLFVLYLFFDFIKKVLVFVKVGGIWIVGFFVGGCLSEYMIYIDCGFGEFEKIVGIKMWFIFLMNENVNIGKVFGIIVFFGMWSVVFDIENGNILGMVELGLGVGYVFLIEQKYGKGKIIMFGLFLLGKEGNVMLEVFVRYYVVEVVIFVWLDVIFGMIVVLCKGDNGFVWIIVNMDGKGGSVILLEVGMDLLMNCLVKVGRLVVGLYEYCVIQFDNYS